MFTHPQQGISKGEVLRLRQEVGTWLKGLREAAGLSQTDLAKSLRIGYYTFISQVESGRARVPPAQIRAWAEALDVAPHVFAIHLFKHYDPVSYGLIFRDNTVPPETSAVINEMDEGRKEKGPRSADETEAYFLRIEHFVDRTEARLNKLERSLTRIERLKRV